MIPEEVEAKLLPSCIGTDEEELEHVELIRWVLDIITKQLDGKHFK